MITIHISPITLHAFVGWASDQSVNLKYCQQRFLLTKLNSLNVLPLLYRDNEVFEDLKKTMESASGPKEEQRQALLYELNSSGKYFAFKEQLKHSVIKIVREKYLQTTNFTSQQQLQVTMALF